MALIKEFPATLLRDELELFDVEPGSEHKGWKVLESTLVDHGRWTVTYEIIFQEPGQPEGQAWKARYAVGATEIQGTTPWQNVVEVRAKAVRLVEVLTEIWQETEDDATPPPLRGAGGMRDGKETNEGDAGEREPAAERGGTHEATLYPRVEELVERV